MQDSGASLGGRAVVPVRGREGGSASAKAGAREVTGFKESFSGHTLYYGSCIAL